MRSALSELVGARSVSFVADGERQVVPTIERDGRIDVHDRAFLGTGFALPAGGVTVAVAAAGTEFGWIVIEPDPTVSVSREERRAAVALTDQFAIALAALPVVPSLD